MATRACPICGERIHPQATQCEHCGGLLGPAPRASALEERRDGARMLPADLDAFAVDYLRGAELRGAYLSRADLFGLDLAGADLRGADLGEANLGNANLRGADLSGANLFGADLGDADLRGADLNGANLTGVDLSGALYDSFTVWPDGFQPGPLGAVHADGEKPG